MKPNIIGLSAQLQNGKDTVAILIKKLTHEGMPEVAFIGNEPIAVYNSKWETKQFAAKLKKMVAILLNCRVEDFEDINFKNKELGEEWRRWFVCDPNILGEDNQPERITPYFASANEATEYVIEHNWDWVYNVQPISELLTPRKILQLFGTEGGRDTIHPNIWVNSTLSEISSNDNVIITDARFPNEVDGIKNVKNGKGIVVRIIRPSMVSTSTHPSETSLNEYTNWDYVIYNDGSFQELEEKVKAMLQHFNII
jgi:hypothetical protein